MYLCIHFPYRISTSNLQLSLLQAACLTLLWCQRLHVPDTLRILVDATITAEESHSSNANNSLANPLILVLIGLVDQCLSRDIGFKVVGDEVVVTMILDCANQGTERTRVAKCTLFYLVKDLGKVGINGMAAIIVSMTKILNILSEISEQEDVFLANFTSDFDLRIVSISNEAIQKRSLRWHHRMYQ
jgi:hypothetical protein